MEGGATLHPPPCQGKLDDASPTFRLPMKELLWLQDGRQEAEHPAPRVGVMGRWDDLRHRVAQSLEQLDVEGVVARRRRRWAADLVR